MAKREREREREREGGGGEGRNPFIDIYIPDEFSRRLLPRMRRASKIPGGAAGGGGAIIPPPLSVNLTRIARISR